MNSELDPSLRGPLLELDRLSVEFKIQGRWTPVVTDVSLAVAQGETLALVGESGSGKTVTSMSMMRLLPPRQSRVTGQIRLEGHDLLAMGKRELGSVRGDKIAMIFQEPMTSLNPAYTVGDQIAEAVRRHRGLDRRAAFRAAVEAMDSVGIPQADERAHFYPHEFSGGMRQRVMIAMAISCEPRLLIADEPTTALDVTIQAQILELLKDLQKSNGMGMIFVTHDLGVVAEIADTVAVMYAGNIVEHGSVREIFARSRHPYTAGLLRSMPDGPRNRDQPIFSIPGAPPRPTDFSSGCRFAPRCEYVTADCSAPVPLRAVEDDHLVRCARVGSMGLEFEEVQHA